MTDSSSPDERPAARDRPDDISPIRTLPNGDRVVTHLSTRSKARKRALDILYEADLLDGDPLGVLEQHTAGADPPVRDFTAQLVRGVVAHRAAIDARIVASLPPHWALERMPRVDRALARLAVYELDHTDVAADIAISEAVLLASGLSTDTSPAFLSGLLGKVAQTPATPA